MNDLSDKIIDKSENLLKLYNIALQVVEDEDKKCPLCDSKYQGKELNEKINNRLNDMKNQKEIIDNYNKKKKEKKKLIEKAIKRLTYFNNYSKNEFISKLKNKTLIKNIEDQLKKLQNFNELELELFKEVGCIINVVKKKL